MVAAPTALHTMAFRSTLTATLFLALASSPSAAAGLRGLVGGYNETTSGETSYYSSIDTSKGGLQAQLHTLIRCRRKHTETNPCLVTHKCRAP
jgi:hypothetical protein